MCASGAMSTLFCVEILMYNVSLIHACIYINDACNFIFTQQQLSKD